jgi:hypothetical protein
MSINFVAPIGMVYYDGFFYVSDYYYSNFSDASGDILKVDPVTLLPIEIFFNGLVGPVGLALDNSGNIYASNYIGGTISKINIANPAIFDISWSTAFLTPWSMYIDGGYMYVSQLSVNTIVQVNILDGSINDPFWATGLTDGGSGILVSGGMMYISTFGAGGGAGYGIVRVPMSTGGAVTPFGNFGTGGPSGLALANGVMYANYTTGPMGTTSIAVIDFATGNVINTTWQSTTQSYNVFIRGSTVYAPDFVDNFIHAFPLYNVVCFLEGTKILCSINDNEVYLPIESIEQGTLVKTFKNGYIPITDIGSGKLYNSGTGVRSKNGLYVYRKEKYNLTEDLIITGCHSILVNEISDSERNDIKKLFGKIFVTDDLYRLMACVDTQSEVYTHEGVCTIWNFALENDNFYGNYGVFANGILVESCSQRMIREYSGFKLKIR